MPDQWHTTNTCRSMGKTNMKNYRFCFDLDGTICENKTEGQDYADVKPLPGAVETLKRLREEGHTIIIMTARNMATHNNNLGKIIAKQGPVVIEWLKKYDIPYDELLFGKPNADFFIDDKGIKLTNWENLNNSFFKNLK